MTNNNVLTHSFGNSIIQQRESDGYINATAMCKATGKLWADYFRLDSTKAFLNELSAVTGYPITALYQVFQGGNSQTSQGTWIHPYIAINLAQWCSPTFAVQVSKWVIDWFKGAQNPITQPSAAAHPLRDAISYVEAAKTAEAIVDPTLRPLLIAKLIQELSQGQSTNPKTAPIKNVAPVATKPKPSRAKPEIIKSAWKEILAVRETWKREDSCYGWLTPDNEAFAYCLNDRQLDLPDWVYDAVPTTRFSTVSRMMAQQQVDSRLKQIELDRQLKKNS
jgi:hypothetical protein